MLKDADNPDIEQAPEQHTLAAFTTPQNAMTDDGDWLVLACTKLWTSREGRRGTVDPSGGMTVAHVYGFEARIAIPLVDNPQSEPPIGTLTLADFQRLVMGPLATATRKSFVPDQEDEF